MDSTDSRSPAEARAPDWLNTRPPWCTSSRRMPDVASLEMSLPASPSMARSCTARKARPSGVRDSSSRQVSTPARVVTSARRPTDWRTAALVSSGARAS
ncbi:MAG TPA: hypothetical protein VEU33_16905, partial [Archangium sp.]|nr:hypothetical protein [Archangium sp.]